MSHRSCWAVFHLKHWLGGGLDLSRQTILALYIKSFKKSKKKKNPFSWYFTRMWNTNHAPLRYWRMGCSLLEEKSKMTPEAQRTSERVTNEKWKDNYKQLSVTRFPRSLHLNTEGTAEETEELETLTGRKWDFSLVQSDSSEYRPQQCEDTHTLAGPHDYGRTSCGVDNWSTPWHFEDQLRILQHLFTQIVHDMVEQHG